jgi:Fur family iron response transcriptional regulator
MTELPSAARPAASPREQTRAWPDQSGCPFHDLRRKLRTAGLRPTRQRVGLGWLLFARGDRHVTAESLYEEAQSARVPVSLATVYNTLHQFRQAGLLREVAVDGAKTYFDTNTGDHHHFFVEGENRLYDIDGDKVGVASLPVPPEGMEIARVDVIVRLRRKS